ncbi:carboxylesterase [Marininema mesophilum]|uniref:Carboxylesterase n=1 Tax=Marininema mesophilum TaxID=1048340 RepID=A0A1H2ZZH6_9BACL|nr:alpha/beta fold hydrolase [Marininema mesophilum]SDX22334.1 carboxylesterase [Marininema mesophilum]
MAQEYTVMKDAEPFYLPGNEMGVLVQHGFTGTTQSVRGLGQFLADQGFTVCGPRLKGHGTHYEDMEGTTYQDWIESTEEGYRKLQETCSHIVVVGLSMGGTLALHLASRYPEIKGVVLVNPAIEMSHLAEVAQMEEPRFFDAIGSDIKAEGVRELAYEKVPLRSFKEIIHLTDETRKVVSAIGCPTLLFKSLEDHLVPPMNAQWIYENIASSDKTLIELENSYHVATLDNDKELVMAETAGFISRLL